MEEFSIIEIETLGMEKYLMDKLYISTDHNPEFFKGAKAIAFNDDLEVYDFAEYKFR